MKQLPEDKNKKTMATVPIRDEDFREPIYADSLEVMEMYAQQKLNHLELKLNLLTVAEHPQEIISLCHDIRRERKSLLKICEKRRRAS